MYEELEEETSDQSLKCQTERKVVYKYIYDTKPKKESDSANFDFEVIDFDHRALRCEPAISLKNCVEENTLCLIKPSAMIYKEQMRKRIFDEGFISLKEKTLKMTKESMSDFYSKHYGKPWFPKFILKMISGPVHVMILAKLNAIEELRQLMGNKRVSVARKDTPYSLRALYGLKGDSATNGIHGSEDRINAVKEIHFFFPQGTGLIFCFVGLCLLLFLVNRYHSSSLKLLQRVRRNCAFRDLFNYNSAEDKNECTLCNTKIRVIPEPLLEVAKYADYVQENMYDVILQGVTEVNKEKPENPVSWLGDWFLQHDYDHPILEPQYLMKALI